MGRSRLGIGFCDVVADFGGLKILMKVGLLLEGGAMRGLYTAGVLDVLMEEKISVDGILGVSAGALFGMNYKSKQIGRVLRYNENFAGNREYMGFYSLLTTGNIMNREFCFNRIVNELDPVDFETFQNSPEEFFAVVTNMHTGKAEYIKLQDLRREEDLEYLRASGSMPFVSKPVIVNGRQYLDGGIADSIPIEEILRRGYDRVVVILTRPIDYRKKKSSSFLPKLVYWKYPDLVEAINRRYLRYNEAVQKVIELEQAGKIFVFRPSKSVKIARIEKNRETIRAMYCLGREDAQGALGALREYLCEEPKYGTGI